MAGEKKRSWHQPPCREEGAAATPLAIPGNTADFGPHDFAGIGGGVDWGDRRVIRGSAGEAWLSCRPATGSVTTASTASATSLSANSSPCHSYASSSSHSYSHRSRGHSLAYYRRESTEFTDLSSLSASSFRPRVATMPSPSHRASHVSCSCPEASHRIRSFSVTAKGGLAKNGDGTSLKIKRNTSNNSVSSSTSSSGYESQRERTWSRGSRVSVTSSDPSNDPAPVRFTVAMLGAADVGKTSLTSQFVSTEPNVELEMEGLDFLFADQTVSIMLDGEESDLTFYDFPSAEKKAEAIITEKDVDAYVVVYSIIDRRSFCRAEAILSFLQQGDFASDKAVILVGNKTDLVRSRVVTSDEGKLLATSYSCKFVETSDWMSHNVDELLVGIFSQIRLKQQRHEQQEKKHDRVHRYKGSKTSLFRSRSIVRNIFRKLHAKARSCDNLFLP